MRIEAKLKMGFYPASVGLVHAVASRIKTHSQAILIDPCAGQGEAVGLLGELLSLKAKQVYAIELDNGRGAKLKQDQRIGHVLAPCDAMTAHIGSGWSLALVNPPFDNEMGGGLRVEAHFFDRIARTARAGSVIVMVMPMVRATNVRSSMNLYCSRIYWQRLPQRDSPYNECLYFCVMRGFAENYQNPQVIELKEGDRTKIQVPRGHPIRFEKGGYTHRELIELANQTKAFALLNTERNRSRLARPPLELSAGHLAMLLAAGQLDGVISGPGLPTHVVRGTASKQQYQKSKERKDNKEITVMGERIRLVIRCLFPDGSIRTIQSSEETPLEEDETDV